VVLVDSRVVDHTLHGAWCDTELGTPEELAAPAFFGCHHEQVGLEVGGDV
jgi:hypothetical protein